MLYSHSNVEPRTAPSAGPDHSKHTVMQVFPVQLRLCGRHPQRDPFPGSGPNYPKVV